MSSLITSGQSILWLTVGRDSSLTSVAPPTRLLAPRVLGKSIYGNKTIGLSRLIKMSRTAHYVAYLCKIGDNESEVIVEITTNNNIIDTHCDKQCARQCIFNNRKFQTMN
jgi:hypothetical protein